jgi:hypothetical protein
VFSVTAHHLPANLLMTRLEGETEEFERMYENKKKMDQER